MGPRLYITRGLVEAQGGEIWVESSPGKGSTFTFTLPVLPEDRAAWPLHHRGEHACVTVRL